MEDEVIAILGRGVMSPLGSNEDEIAASTSSRSHCLSLRRYGAEEIPVGALTPSGERRIETLIAEKRPYKKIDRSVLLAILAARDAFQSAKWDGKTGNIGVNIGSSRGATELFERFHAEFLESRFSNQLGRTATLTSPTTTLGNISSWVAQDLGIDGSLISHSATCSTALQAIGNALAWLRSGMSDRFVAGAAEAPLTPFTIAQMRALRIYSPHIGAEYPCRPLAADDPPENTFVLGEGAAVFALERFTRRGSARKDALAFVDGYGCAVEELTSPTSISEEGACFERAMRRALASMRSEREVDAIILHAPGTIVGDAAELKAIRSVFGSPLPILLSQKWKIGHLFGASGALAISLAIDLLHAKSYAPFPYAVRIENPARPIRKVMVNAAGFGGAAASVILEAPS